MMIQHWLREWRSSCSSMLPYGPLTRYVKLRVAHAPGMPGTFSPPPISKETAIVSDPSMHNGTCVTHVPWCMSGWLTRGGGEYIPGIPGACATRNFTYLARGPWHHQVTISITELKVCKIFGPVSRTACQSCVSFCLWMIVWAAYSSEWLHCPSTLSKRSASMYQTGQGPKTSSYFEDCTWTHNIQLELRICSVVPCLTSTMP